MLELFQAILQQVVVKILHIIEPIEEDPFFLVVELFDVFVGVLLIVGEENVLLLLHLVHKRFLLHLPQVRTQLDHVYFHVLQLVIVELRNALYR